jgi:hypothetical protein
MLQGTVSTHAQREDVMTEQERTERRDGGAYIGNRPELAEETIPGGVGPDDERVAAHDSRSSGEGKRSDRVEARDDEWPGGHRDAEAGGGR